MSVERCDVVDEHLVAVDDLHAASAEDVRRPHEHRVADALGDRARLVVRRREAVARGRQPGGGEHLAERPAVLGQVDRLGARADDRDAGVLQLLREAQRRLAAELHEHADELAAALPRRLLLGRDDLEDVLDGERLEVEAVAGVVVGRDRLGVAVDHHGLEAGLGERERRVDAGVVELDALADAVRPAAEDEHLAAARRRDLGLLVVGAVVVGRLGGELGRAGVDRLVDRPDAELPAPGPHVGLGEPADGARSAGRCSPSAWRAAAGPRRARAPPRARPAARRATAAGRRTTGRCRSCRAPARAWHRGAAPARRRAAVRRAAPAPARGRSRPSPRGRARPRSRRASARASASPSAAPRRTTGPSPSPRRRSSSSS